MSYNLNGALYGGNLCLTKAALAAGTTSTITTTGTTTYSVVGQAYTKAAITNAATPVLDITTGLAFVKLPVPTATVQAKACIIVIGYDAGGTVRAAQGPLVNVIDVTNLVSGSLPIGENVTLTAFGKKQTNDFVLFQQTFTVTANQQIPLTMAVASENDLLAALAAL